MKSYSEFILINKIKQFLEIKSNLKLVAKDKESSYYKYKDNKEIKVTTNKENALNLIKSQKLNSKNIIKVFDYNYIENHHVLVLEKIKGKHFPYTTKELEKNIDDKKLEDLFQTIKNLKKIGIDFKNISDNVVEYKDKYIIIDF